MIGGDLSPKLPGLTNQNQIGNTSGTLNVSHGGTGATSHTAYGVITGGTISTGPEQTVSPSADSTSVLQCGNTSGLPTWVNTLSSTIQGNITTVGTITTGTWSGTAITLAKGGTNANLTASNGGIFYSTASAGAILSGTATANQVLLSGSSTTPAWSTATYPATTTASQILYSSATNTVTGLATANSSILVTDGSGVPSLGTTIPFTVPVTTGGTGLATATTAYGVVCGGTTATGNFQVIASLGSSGNVLTSNGPSALPSWQAGGGGGGGAISKNTQATASSSATLSFTSLASTNDYLLIFRNILPATASANLQMQFSTNNGSSYDSTAGHYQHQGNSTGLAANFYTNTSDTKIVLSTITSGGNGISSTANLGGLNGFIHLYNPANASYMYVNGQFSWTVNGGATNSVFLSGTYILTAGVVNAVQFLMSSGNIASGSITLYNVTQ